jgi:hypothetical protein
MTSTILDFIDTVVADQLESLAGRLQDLGQRVRTPPHNPLNAVEGLHFASLAVFETSGFDPILVFESNFDGSLADYLDRLLAVAAADVHAVFSCCRDYHVTSPTDTSGIAAYLRTHVVRPAAYHIGNVGRSRVRVEQEAVLYTTLGTRIDANLEAGRVPASAGAAFSLVRREMEAAGGFQWVDEPHDRQTAWERAWPWIRLIGIPAIALVIVAMFWRIAIPALVVAAAVVVALLRYKETHDRPMQESEVDPLKVQRLTQLEDFVVQNHLASLTVVKPGVFRRVLLRGVLWTANLIARTSTHGSLSGIPSIHYAHWALIDRGRRLLFLSNYDGSWESYLGDFIDKASRGLTGVWSNTVGFPVTDYLVFKGAADGDAFKRFARSEQASTVVWYSAYPRLTVQQIDRQSTFREGLASKPVGDALKRWLKSC